MAQYLSHNLEEEGFILAYDSWGFRPRLVCSVVSWPMREADCHGGESGGQNEGKSGEYLPERDPVDGATAI